MLPLRINIATFKDKYFFPVWEYLLPSEGIILSQYGNFPPNYSINLRRDYLF